MNVFSARGQATRAAQKDSNKKFGRAFRPELTCVHAQRSILTIMEKFLFIIREDLGKLRKWNEEQRYDGVREMDVWVKELIQKGNYITGDALHIKGGYVSKDNVLSDGPFIEAKEGISGIMFIEAKDLQDAASIAQTCPLVQSGNMAIEVRPLMGVKDIREIGDGQRTTGG